MNHSQSMQKLRSNIVDIVLEEVPVKVDRLKFSTKRWDRLANRVIKRVVDSLMEMVSNEVEP